MSVSRGKPMPEVLSLLAPGGRRASRARGRGALRAGAPPLEPKRAGPGAWLRCLAAQPQGFLHRDMMSPLDSPRNVLDH